MDKIKSLLKLLQSKRGEMKKSPFKIWLRAFLLIQFSVFFSIYFVYDIGNGYFSWSKVLITILLFIPIGFLMSKLVPMRADVEENAIILSIDKIYLVLIWVLVITKLVASHAFDEVVIADVIMCVIIGIMGGRLGGIGLRVRKLKLAHGVGKK